MFLRLVARYSWHKCFTLCPFFHIYISKMYIKWLFYVMDYFCLSLKILTVLGRRGSKQLSGYQVPSECYYFSQNSTKGAANSFFFSPSLVLFVLFCFSIEWRNVFSGWGMDVNFESFILRRLKYSQMSWVDEWVVGDETGWRRMWESLIPNQPAEIIHLRKSWK